MNAQRHIDQPPPEPSSFGALPRGGGYFFWHDLSARKTRRSEIGAAFESILRQENSLIRFANHRFHNFRVSLHCQDNGALLDAVTATGNYR